MQHSLVFKRWPVLPGRAAMAPKQRLSRQRPMGSTMLLSAFRRSHLPVSQLNRQGVSVHPPVQNVVQGYRPPPQKSQHLRLLMLGLMVLSPAAPAFASDMDMAEASSVGPLLFLACTFALGVWLFLNPRPQRATQMRQEAKPAEEAPLTEPAAVPASAASAPVHTVQEAKPRVWAVLHAQLQALKEQQARGEGELVATAHPISAASLVQGSSTTSIPFAFAAPSADAEFDGTEIDPGAWDYERALAETDTIPHCLLPQGELQTMPFWHDYDGTQQPDWSTQAWYEPEPDYYYYQTNAWRWDEHRSGVIEEFPPVSPYGFPVPKEIMRLRPGFIFSPQVLRSALFHAGEDTDDQMDVTVWYEDNKEWLAASARLPVPPTMGAHNREVMSDDSEKLLPLTYPAEFPEPVPGNIFSPQVLESALCNAGMEDDHFETHVNAAQQACTGLCGRQGANGLFSGGPTIILDSLPAPFDPLSHDGGCMEDRTQILSWDAHLNMPEGMGGVGGGGPEDHTSAPIEGAPERQRAWAPSPSPPPPPAPIITIDTIQMLEASLNLPAVAKPVPFIPLPNVIPTRISPDPRRMVPSSSSDWTQTENGSNSNSNGTVTVAFDRTYTRSRPAWAQFGAMGLVGDAPCGCGAGVVVGGYDESMTALRVWQALMAVGAAAWACPLAPAGAYRLPAATAAGSATSATAAATVAPVGSYDAVATAVAVWHGCLAALAQPTAAAVPGKAAGSPKKRGRKPKAKSATPASETETAASAVLVSSSEAVSAATAAAAELSDAPATAARRRKQAAATARGRKATPAASDAAAAAAAVPAAATPEAAKSPAAPKVARKRSVSVSKKSPAAASPAPQSVEPGTCALPLTHQHQTAADSVTSQGSPAAPAVLDTAAVASSAAGEAAAVAAAAGPAEGDVLNNVVPSAPLTPVFAGDLGATIKVKVGKALRRVPTKTIKVHSARRQQSPLRHAAPAPHTAADDAASTTSCSTATQATAVDAVVVASPAVVVPFAAWSKCAAVVEEARKSKGPSARAQRMTRKVVKRSPTPGKQ